MTKNCDNDRINDIASDSVYYFLPAAPPTFLHITMDRTLTNTLSSFLSVFFSGGALAMESAVHLSFALLTTDYGLLTTDY